MTPEKFVDWLTIRGGHLLVVVVFADWYLIVLGSIPNSAGIIV